jgi:sugar lactone lactonase YvrE
VDAAGGVPQPVVRGLAEPEGIAVRPDGRLIVVEQKTNRLWLADPPTGDKTLLRQLENTTGKDGVDGIAIDPRDGRILVPDSPNGRLLALDPDGSHLQVLATGFVRPTGVALLPDGDWLVADEFGNALIRVTPDGRKRRLVGLYQPDDVVVDADGMAYANGLNGIIYRVDPATGAATRLLTGLILPHGLGLDSQGRVVVAEAGRNRLFRIEP